MIALAVLLGLTGGGAGAFALRRAWADRQPERRVLLTTGWVLLTGAVLLDAALVGRVKGAALGIAAAGVGTLAVVIAGRARSATRAGRDARRAPEPLDSPSRAWRGWVKALLAGPLGKTAAMAVAFCYAAWMPGASGSAMCVRLTDRALRINDRAPAAPIRLKQCAPETTLYCVSSRSSLQAATVT